MSQDKIPTRLVGYVEKGWGHEYIFATNNLYCGKLLVFNKTGNKFSMHFHKEKDETWYVLEGAFKLTTINTQTGKEEYTRLVKGTSIRIKPLTIHQLTAVEDNSVIIEVSTADSVEDNYRVAPGDSQ